MEKDKSGIYTAVKLEKMQSSTSTCSFLANITACYSQVERQVAQPIPLFFTAQNG